MAEKKRTAKHAACRPTRRLALSNAPLEWPPDALRAAQRRSRRRLDRRHVQAPSAVDPAISAATLPPQQKCESVNY
jgi:hypothetical protein